MEVNDDLRGGEARTGALWEETLGEEDFFLAGGEVPLEGDDTLPERSSDVTARLALWELSDRSLEAASIQEVSERTSCIEDLQPQDSSRAADAAAGHSSTVPALLLLLFMLLCISSPIFALLLLLLRLLLVLVFAFVFLPHHGQFQGDRGRWAGSARPLLLAVTPL